MKEIVRQKALALVKVYGIILGVMWLVFLLNNGLLNASLSDNFGIEPRQFTWGAALSLFTSWAFHGSLAHITGNSVVLLGTLWVIAVADKHPLRTIALLIGGSGLATWLLGWNHTLHIGASGLIFAIFGYVIATALRTRHWMYMGAAVLFGIQYYMSVATGLMPKSGVSLAAHLGGLVAGILIGSFMSKNRKKDSYVPYSYKEPTVWEKTKTKLKTLSASK